MVRCEVASYALHVKAPSPQPGTLSLDVTIAGAEVKQTFDVQDWSYSAPGPGGTPRVVSLRVFKPGTEVLRHLASLMVAHAGAGDTPAARELSLHQLGSLLNPEGVLNTRPLTGRDLERAFECGARGAAAAFERAVRENAAKASPADVESALVSALVGRVDADFSKHSRWARRRLGALASVAGREHARIYRDLRTAGETYRRFDLPELERDGLHRARELLRRQLLSNTEIRRAAAFEYLGEADRMVDKANRLNLEVLRRSGKASAQELRVFEFLFLRRPRACSRVHRGRPWFRGIIGTQPYLMSLLMLSPSTWAALDAAVFSRGALAQPDEALQRQIAGLLEAGEYVLEAVRLNERERATSRRSRMQGAEHPSPAQTTALEILRARRQVTAPERGVVERLAAGETPTEVGRSLGVSRQAVMNRLRRASKRPPLPVTPKPREDPMGMDVATFLRSRRRW